MDNGTGNGTGNGTDNGIGNGTGVVTEIDAGNRMDNGTGIDTKNRAGNDTEIRTDIHIDVASGHQFHFKNRREIILPEIGSASAKMFRAGPVMIVALVSF